MGEGHRAVPTAGFLVGVLEMIGRWRRLTKRDISHRLPNTPSHETSVIAVESARTSESTDPVHGHSITEVDVRVVIATPRPGFGVDRPTIVIDDVDRPQAGAATDPAPEPTSGGTPPKGTEPDHLPLDMLLLLFNRYDELARGKVYVDLDRATMDDDVWLDLVEGPAARFVDRALSSRTHRTIRLVTGETIRRLDETASWDVDLVETDHVDDATPGQSCLVIELEVFAIDTSG
jgi:hypothetical protein